MALSFSEGNLHRWIRTNVINRYGIDRILELLEVDTLYYRKIACGFSISLNVFSQQRMLCDNILTSTSAIFCSVADWRIGGVLLLKLFFEM